MLGRAFLPPSLNTYALCHRQNIFSSQEFRFLHLSLLRTFLLRTANTVSLYKHGAFLDLRLPFSNMTIAPTVSRTWRLLPSHRHIVPFNSSRLTFHSPTYHSLLSFTTGARLPIALPFAFFILLPLPEHLLNKFSLFAMTMVFHGGQTDTSTALTAFKVLVFGHVTVL